MRYFKQSSGKIMAVDKGQDHIVTADWVEVPEDQVRKLLNPTQSIVSAMEKLSYYHDAYTKNHVKHRGIMISIDTEARVNADGVLRQVEKGAQPLPFRWYSGGEYITVETVEDMQGIHDAIYSGLSRGFAAKDAVIDQINATDDIENFDVQAAWDAAIG